MNRLKKDKERKGKRQPTALAGKVEWTGEVTDREGTLSGPRLGDLAGTNCVEDA